MDDETEETLTEVLAQLYEAEDEAREVYGGVHPKHVGARRNIERLLFPEDDDVDPEVAADRADSVARLDALGRPHDPL